MAVCEEICKQEQVVLKDKIVAVVGLGTLVGKPIAVWLMKKAKAVYALDQGSDINILHHADIVITGVGKAGLITADMVKSGTTVIDFGYSFDEDGKICGDFIDNAIHEKGAYTPTPGGTGPILVAKLMENYFQLSKIAERNRE